MNNCELAKSKLERANALYQNFDEISEVDMKNILHCLLTALELTSTKNPNRHELYGYVRNIATRDIKKYGVIFKAMNWKDSVMIKKEDVGILLQQINDMIC